MQVWLFTMSQRINDAENTRTFLLARQLIKRGHQVTLWTSAFDHMEKKFRRRHGEVEVLPNGIRAIYLAGCGYRTNVSIKRYVDHWLVSRRFQRVAAAQPPPDVAVVSLPDHQLADAALRYLRQLRVPVIVDIRDQWPDLFLNVIRRPLVRLIARSLLWRDRAMVRRAIAQADSVVSMMQALLSWGQGLAGRPANTGDRVFYLAINQRIPRQLPIESASPAVLALLRAINGRPFHLFVGTFGIYYNPLLLVQAAQELHQAGHPQPFDIVIGGTGTNFEEVRAAARDLPHIHFTGWLAKSDVDLIVSHAATGVIPCNLPVDSFPNKSFTYLAGSLPLISSVSGDIERAIIDRGIGLQFSPGNAAELAAQLRRIELDPALLARLSANAGRFFEEELDSDRTYTAYADHVAKVAAGRTAR